MKPSAFVYRRPDSLEQALSLLQEGEDEARVIAGGQSLVPAMNLRMATPAMLVDLSGIEDLSALQVDADGSLAAGAMVTHNRFLRDRRVTQGWPMIALAVKHVAHEQVRNRGTLGGSLCHADPAAEWSAVCLMLDARMTLLSADGQRVIPAKDFIKGVYDTALAPGELLTHVHFPATPQSWRWGFHEIARRQGDFAMAGALVGLSVGENSVVNAARLVVFAVEDRARRLDAVLAGCVGHSVNDIDVESVGLTAAAEVDPRSDLHATAELRSHLVHTCVMRALADAIQPLPGV